MSKIDEMRALERAATPGPWRCGELRGAWEIISTEYMMVGEVCKQEDMELIVVMRNALPGLLNAMEEGRLVELPCPIGTKIFEADGHTGKVYETKAWKEHMLSMIAPMWGKRYFATRAEAEAALLKEGTE